MLIYILHVQIKQPNNTISLPIFPIAAPNIKALVPHEFNY